MHSKNKWLSHFFEEDFDFDEDFDLAGDFDLDFPPFNFFCLAWIAFIAFLAPSS